VHNKCCEMSVLTMEVCKRIDAAVSEISAFWSLFKTEMSAYCVGTVGLSDDMIEIQQCMSTAWWLPDVMRLPAPSAEHKKACIALYGHMNTDLKASLWPDDVWCMTPSVKKWPTDRGMSVLYERWWRRIHVLGNEVGGEYRRRWHKVRGYRVEVFNPHIATAICRAAWPLHIGPKGGRPNLGSTHGLFGGRKGHSTILRSIASRIQGFLSHGIVRVWQSKDVEQKPSELINIGDFVSAGGCTGRVIQEILELDQREVAASLENDRRFSDECWHANRFFCRCRRMNGIEAPCESWVGSMKYLFDPIQGPSTPSMVQRACLHAAGVRGNGADDEFVRRVAKKMSQHRNRHTPSGISKKMALMRKHNDARIRVRALKGIYVDMSKKGAEESEKPRVGVCKHARALKKHARARYEPANLDAADLKFVNSMKKQRATMPLYERTKREWQKLGKDVKNARRGVLKRKVIPEASGKTPASGANDAELGDASSDSDSDDSDSSHSASGSSETSSLS